MTHEEMVETSVIHIVPNQSPRPHRTGPSSLLGSSPNRTSGWENSPGVSTCISRKDCCLNEADSQNCPGKSSPIATYNDDELTNIASEAKHFSEVCYCISNYSLSCMNEVARIERNFQALSKDDASLLSWTTEERIYPIKEAIMHNQEFLNLLVIEAKGLDHGPAFLTPTTPHPGNCNYQYHNDPHLEGSPCCDEGDIACCDAAATSGHFNSLTSSPDRSNNPNLRSEECRCEAQRTDVSNIGHEPKSKQCLSSTDSTDVSSPHSQRQLHQWIKFQDASKVRSTLRVFARDWSEDGKRERDAAYGPLLQDLEEFLPLKQFENAHHRLPKILCPGSGLGRLPFEVALRGYACQGNEFSYYMLLGSSLILNSCIAVNSIKIYPYVLSTSNRLKHHDHLKLVLIPDVCPGDFVACGHDFSMCAGEFVEVYESQPQAFDGILTSFFIDTAKNIILYIRTIATILRPGGYWFNLGPLLYHFADSPHEPSIELSWEEVRAVIAPYFDILKEDMVDAYYTTNFASMMQIQYHCIHFAARRNSVPMVGHSNPVY